MSDADSLPVPLEFRGDTEEECREAMNCLSAYLVAEADMAKKRNPPGWKLELDIRWDELVITWAKIYGYTVRLVKGGGWEVLCYGKKKEAVH